MKNLPFLIALSIILLGNGASYANSINQKNIRLLTPTEEHLISAIKKNRQAFYNWDINAIKQTLAEIKSIDDSLPDIKFFSSDEKQKQDYFESIGYVFVNKFVEDSRDGNLKPSTFLAKIKEKGKKEISFGKKKVTIDYFITERPEIDFVENNKKLSYFAWSDDNSNKIYMNSAAIDFYLKMSESDNSIIGKLCKKQKAISGDRFEDDFYNTLFIHEAAHKIGADEEKAIFYELAYGATPFLSLANLIGMVENEDPKYKNPASRIISMILNASGKASKEELIKSVLANGEPYIKHLALNVLTSTK